MPVFFQSCGEDRYLGILSQTLVDGSTPDHIDIGIQLIKEIIYLLHLPDEDRRFLTGVDIKEDTFGLADIITVKQGRVERVDDCLLHTMLSTGAPHGHDGTTAILHRGLHITEIEVDTSLAIYGDELGYSFYGIFQDIVGTLECFLHRDIAVGIHVTESFVVYDQQCIHVLAQFFHTL